MPEPRRVRVEGDLFHGRVPPGAVYVGRAAPGLPRSPFANPYKVDRDVADAAAAVERYRTKLLLDQGFAAAAAEDLAGFDLACWCPLPPPGQPDLCHAAVLLEFVAASSEDYSFEDGPEDPA